MTRQLIDLLMASRPRHIRPNRVAEDEGPREGLTGDSRCPLSDSAEAAGESDRPGRCHLAEARGTSKDFWK